MNRLLPHHHIVEGISIAHQGDLPADLVLPSAENFENSTAQEYGWEWWGGSISGRPASHMPKSRKLDTFGEVDIEGDQVTGASRYYGEVDGYGFRNHRRIEGRTELLDLFAQESTEDIADGYTFGCFQQHFQNYPVTFIGAALLPAKRVVGNFYAATKRGKYLRNNIEPVADFEQASPTLANMKWRKYGLALLLSPEYTEPDHHRNRC